MELQQKKRILLVEDAMDMQLLLKHLFLGEGYEVFCASNGLEALNLLRSMVLLPSLILLDLMMPVMDGFQFRAEQVRDEKFAHIPVVVMTADGNLQMKKTKIGADDFLKKPSDVDVILETVKRYCS